MNSENVLLDAWIGKMPDLKKPTALFNDGNHAIYWLGIMNETAFRCNSYLIVSEDEAILIDSGGRHFFKQVYKRVSSIIDPEKVTGIVLSHQDPDVAASMTDWLELYPDIQIFSTPRTHVLLPHYGRADYKMYDVEKDYRYTFKNGKSIIFIPAPFLHFPGAFATFDETSGFLFSGDIWAALDIDWKLIVEEFDEHISNMDLFHKDYMASNSAARYFVRSISGLDIKAILPQHGSIIMRKDVKAAIEYLEHLECGIDLLYADEKSYPLVYNEESGEIHDDESEFKEILLDIEELTHKILSGATSEERVKNKLLKDALQQSSRVARIRDKAIISLKTTKEALKKSHAAIEIIDRLRSQFIANPDPFEMYDRLLEDILQFTGSLIGFIGETRADKENTPYIKIYSLSNISWNEESRQMYENRRTQDFEFKKLNTLYGQVLIDGKPVISNNPSNDSRSGGLPKGHPAINSFLGIPVFFGDKIVGEVGIANREGGYDTKIIGSIESVFFALGQIIVARQNLEARIKAEIELKKMNETLAERVELEVAERIRVEKEKKEQEELLVQQSKMAAMGEMISAISHQWRQPLNVISLYAQDIEEVIEYYEKPEEELKKIGKNIVAQVDFMMQTMEDFKNFFRPSKEMHPFTACESISEVINMFQELYRTHNIQIVIHPHEHYIVFGYPNEFKQAILNILSNARDVIIEKGIKNGTIDCFFEQRDGYGIIRIRDNGGGIKEELLPDKIFEAYITTKGEEGTGIGLRISKSIIESNMNGKLWVHNVVGGAEFVIELPLAKKAE